MKKAVQPVVLAIAAIALTVPPAGAAKAADAIANAYRDVLGRLAVGDVDTALQNLSQLEKNAIGESQNRKAVDTLWTTKLRVIRDLIQAESLDVLVPIIVFHHEAAAVYRDERQPVLALHSRHMVDELADFYAKRADDPKADVFTGWVLSSLAGYVQEARSFSTSRALFQRALDIDPANEFALLSVGVSLEMHGRYWEAVDYYNRLLGVRPDHAEARLRASLSRLKGKIPDEVEFRAVRELEGVARDSSAPEWVRTVAYQELAALHMREERRGEAEKWLREGLELVPTDQTLRIQLASILERRGQRRDAQRLLQPIQPRPDGGDSPRRRYDRVATEGLEEGRETMRRMMAARLALLSAGLGVPQAPGGAQPASEVGR